MSEIKKRFPSDNSLDYPTFLNDKHICGELYATLLMYSIVQYNTNKTMKPYTYCKKDMINMTELAKQFGCGRTTLYTKLNYLIEHNYLKEDEQQKGYIFCQAENAWRDIPLKTLKYLYRTTNLTVIKVYIYLGLMFDWKRKIEPIENYRFTEDELIQHCGIIRGRGNVLGYETVTDILDMLLKCHLIEFKKIYLQNNKQQTYPNYILTNWTDHIQREWVETIEETVDEIKSAKTQRKILKKSKQLGE